jgi:hypothetical protein
VNDSDAGITGSGANTRVAFWTGASTQSSSANFIWDNTNSRLGVGGTFAETTLHVNGSVFIGGSSTIGLQLENALSTAPSSNVRSIIANTSSSIAVAGALFLQPRTSVAAPILFYTEGSERARLHSTGNFGIGTGATDSGQRLQVVGTTLLNGNVTFSSATGMFWDATNNRLGIGLNSPTSRLHVSSSAWNSTDPFVSFQNLDVNGAEAKGLYVQAGALSGSSYIVNFANYSGTSLFYLDGLGNLGIKTTSPTYALDVADAARFRNQIRFSDGWNVSHADSANRLFFSTSGSTFFGSPSGYIWQNGSSSAIMSLFNSGNLVIQNGGTHIDGGQRLQVTGTSYFSDSVGIGSTTLTGYGLRINKDITGATSAFGVSVGGQILSDVQSTAALYATNAVTQNATFTLTNLTHYRAAQGALGASSTVTNQHGFFAASSLTGATNDYGFYGDLAAATNVWNLYMNGTANNYMAGSLGIGINSLTGYNLRVNKTITGSTFGFNVSVGGAAQSDVTNNASYIHAISSTQAATFTLPQIRLFSAEQGTFGAGSTVTDQIGFFAQSSLIGATNNFGFYGLIAAGTGRWNLYMGGTALNYLNGNLLIGSTTDSGEKLQVTGTAKITGATSIGGAVSVTGGNLTVIKNSGSPSIIGVTDGTNTTSTEAYFNATAGTTQGFVLSWGQTKSTYKILGAGDVALYKSNTAGDVAIFNDGTSGNIKFAAGGSSTEQMRLTTAGNLCIGVNSGGDFLNIAAATTAKAQINLAAGTAPTSPNNGDIWFDGTDLKIRIGGVTKTFTLI